MSLTEQARWFVLGGDHLVLLDQQGEVPQGSKACLPTALADAHFERFDEWQGLPCYLLDLGAEAATTMMAPLRQLMVAGDEEGFRLAGRAWQLATFRRTHRFCGECGAPMT
ncbi:MAG: NAD(+) diphosphatase, partial [Aeromonas veronii]